MRDPGATMIVLPADHLIKDVAGFQKTLRASAAAAQESGELVTIGIKPTWACPGFGYIEMGKEAALKKTEEGVQIHEVARFREKPVAALAETFLEQGNFRWNAGMFNLDDPVDPQRIPPAHAGTGAVHRATPRRARTCRTRSRSISPHLPKISIDYAVMEKAARALVVEAAFDWDDVGSWTAAAKYWKQDGDGNIGNADITTVDASNNIVYTTEKVHVALMGVKNLIVVQTGDSILIADITKPRRSRTSSARSRRNSSKPAMKRILGIDHGDARFGLALSDELGMLAHPLETIKVKEQARPRRVTSQKSSSANKSRS